MPTLCVQVTPTTSERHVLQLAILALSRRAMAFTYATPWDYGRVVSHAHVRLGRNGIVRKRRESKEERMQFYSSLIKWELASRHFREPLRLVLDEFHWKEHSRLMSPLPSSRFFKHATVARLCRISTPTPRPYVQETHAMRETPASLPVTRALWVALPLIHADRMASGRAAWRAIVSIDWDITIRSLHRGSMRWKNGLQWKNAHS